MIEHENALADPHDDLHVVLDQQHGDLELVLDEADQTRERLFLGGIHPGGGLVEQQQFWLGRQRPHDLQPALVAVRQVFAEHIAVLAEVENIEAGP